MSCANILYLNEPSELDVKVKQGQNWPFRTTRIADGEPSDLTGYTGKMRIYDVTTAAILGVAPSFVATDLATGQYGFDMTIADTQNLPFDHELLYEMWIINGATSIPTFNGSLIIVDGFTPIP